jgi:hypothetical protein
MASASPKRLGFDDMCDEIDARAGEPLDAQLRPLTDAMEFRVPFVGGGRASTERGRDWLNLRWQAPELRFTLSLYRDDLRSCQVDGHLMRIDSADLEIVLMPSLP